MGRGSSIEAFPLFGFRLEDYDALFAEKLELLLTIREHEHVDWSGKYRCAIDGPGGLPEAGAGFSPDLARCRRHPGALRRAGALGLPLMVAIIGGEPRRFRPRSISTGRPATRAFRRSTEVGVHVLGYVAETTQQAADEFFPGYAQAMTDVGKERGWAPMTRASFDAHGVLAARC